MKHDALPAATAPSSDRHAPGPDDAYRQILRSCALIGSSQLVGMVLAIGRVKAMALMLGPASFGLMGTYTAIVDLTRTIAQMGVNASGVRQIAQAVARGDEAQVAATSLTLKRVACATAALGALLLLGGSPWISEISFGTAAHAGDVALLSAAVFFGVLAGGQTALIQGMRRIADLSRLAVIGAFAGTVASLLLVYLLRERGLALSLVVAAAAAAIVGGCYSRRIVLVDVRLRWRDSRSQAGELFKLGTAFVAGDLLVQGAAYLVRITLLRQEGLEASGLYQAAWTLGGLYVGFLLQSMGSDFYPRLVACIDDHEAANRLVNQQAAVSMLLAGPGVLATLAFAPMILHLLYSAKFDGAVETLRWICFGMALRVISWPMGFVIAAAGRQAMFLGAEVAWTAVYVGLTAALVPAFGAAGAGLGFFLSYVFHVLMLWPLVRRLTGFGWTAGNLRLGALYLGCCSVVLAAAYALPPGPAAAVGALLLLVLSLHSLRRLAQEAALPAVPARVAALVRAVLQIGRKAEAARSALIASLRTQRVRPKP